MTVGKVIVVDIDGVILDFNSAFARWMAIKFNDNEVPANPTSYGDVPYESYIGDRNLLVERLNIFTQCNEIQLNLICTKLPELFKDLRSRGHYIVVVTQCINLDVRRKTLIDLDIEYDEIRLCAEPAKLKLVKGLGAAAMIEDCPSTVRTLAHAGIPVLCPALWNYTCGVIREPNVIGYYSTNQLRAHLIMLLK